MSMASAYALCIAVVSSGSQACGIQTKNRLRLPQRHSRCRTTRMKSKSICLISCRSCHASGNYHWSRSCLLSATEIALVGVEDSEHHRQHEQRNLPADLLGCC